MTMASSGRMCSWEVTMPVAWWTTARRLQSSVSSSSMTSGVSCSTSAAPIETHRKRATRSSKLRDVTRRWATSTPSGWSVVRIGSARIEPVKPSSATEFSSIGQRVGSRPPKEPDTTVLERTASKPGPSPATS
jgi:hypothetical protein